MSPFHSWYWLWKVKVRESVAQSCLTPWNPMDCSLPGSAVHGILQARRLEWVAIPFSRRSSWPKDWTRSPALQADFYLISLPSEPAGSPDIGYNKPLFEYLACQQGRLSWVTYLDSVATCANQRPLDALQTCHMTFSQPSAQLTDKPRYCQ